MMMQRIWYIVGILLSCKDLQIYNQGVGDASVYVVWQLGNMCYTI